MDRRSIIMGTMAVGLAPLLTAAEAPPPMPRYPLSDEALVYFYHLRTRKRDGRVYWMKIDGTNVAKLDSGDYSWVYIKPGPHVLTNRAPLDIGITPQARKEWPINVEGGNIYYIRFTSDAKRLEELTRGLPQNTDFEMSEVEAGIARREMRTSIYRAPGPEWPLER